MKLMTTMAALAALASASTADARQAVAKANVAPVTLAANAHDDVYIVTSLDHYAKHGAVFGKRISTRRAKDGSALVVARLKEHQLPDLGRTMHEDEQVCGGYFAFSTLAEAEQFAVLDRGPRPAGTVPLTYTIDNRAVVGTLLPLPSEANIRNTITSLSSFPNRYYNSAYGADASVAIRDLWRGIAGNRSDVTVELVACTAGINCGVQSSIVLTIKGNKRPHEVVVLGGHMDSISNVGTGNAMNAPGADDDASGIATLTEVLRVAMANDYRPDRTVKFMAYAAEEVGLRGSRSIAQSFAAQRVNVVGALQLDMTNYRTAALNMRIVTDFSSEPLKTFFASLFDTYLLPLGYTRGLDTCGYACSDHASWTAVGYPAAMMFEAGEDDGDYFPYIHTVNDRLVNMGNNATPSVPFAQFGLAFLAEMGKGTLREGSISGNGPRSPLPLPPRQR